jgi:kumamolisin
MSESPIVNAPRFAAQARVVLKGSEKAPAPNAQHVKSTPAQRKLTVSLILKRKEPLECDESGGRSTGPVRVSREEYKARHTADPEALALVEAFAKEFHLKVERGANAVTRRTVQLTGTAANMQDAFGVALEQKIIDGVEYRVREGGIQLPAALIGSVIAVLGLDNRPQAMPHIRIRKVHDEAAHAETATAPASYTPPQVAEAYQFPTSVTGAGQTIAIIELGGGYRQSDLTTYFKGLGIAAPSVKSVSVDGGKNSPSSASTSDSEVMLDIEVVGSVAPGAKIVVYFTPNTDQGFTDAISTAIHDETNKPSVISISWGGPESTWTAQAMTALDAACQSAAALGITVTVAAGDNGSTDGATGNNVDFPASSPHVLACGGTKLNASGATIVSEVVWNELAGNDGATGGGVSNFFALPVWQANSHVPAPAQTAGGRGVPDVSGDADPNTGYKVRVDGQDSVVGGTSAVAPLWAGLAALANQQLGAKVGFIQPAIYAAGAAAAFNDVTEGNNGGFNAGPGWDACTGQGTPKAAALIPLLAPAGPAPTPAPAPAPPKKKKKKKPVKHAPVKKKATKTAPGKKTEKKAPEKPVKSEKPVKANKADKPEKAGKPEKTGKPEKSGKTEKPGKTKKSGETKKSDKAAKKAEKKIKKLADKAGKKTERKASKKAGNKDSGSKSTKKTDKKDSGKKADKKVSGKKAGKKPAGRKGKKK